MEEAGPHQLAIHSTAHFPEVPWQRSKTLAVQMYHCAGRDPQESQKSLLFALLWCNFYFSTATTIISMGPMVTRYLQFLNLHIPHHCHIWAPHLMHLIHATILREGKSITSHWKNPHLRNINTTYLSEAATEDWWLELSSLKSWANALATRLCVFSETSQPGNMLYANLDQEIALESWDRRVNETSLQTSLCTSQLPFCPTSLALLQCIQRQPDQNSVLHAHMCSEKTTLKPQRCTNSLYLLTAVLYLQTLSVKPTFK